MRLGSHLQAAQMRQGYLGQPGQHGRDIGTAQGLLGRPQASRGHVGLHAQQAGRINLPGSQCWAAGHKRGAYEHHSAASSEYAACRQNRCQQAPFTAARLRLQQLGHGTHGPAAAGQGSVERGVAGVQRVLHGGSHLTRTPDGCRQEGRERKSIRRVFRRRRPNDRHDRHGKASKSKE